MISDGPWTYVVAAVVSYLLGSVNPASVMARVRHIDLRSTGSGNPGATNAARAMGTTTGTVVGVIDVLKGFVPAMAFTMLAGPSVGDVAGFCAVLGHITSPWLKGHGGKGVATTLGAVMGTHPFWLLAILPAFALGFWGFRRIGLASVVACLSLIVVAFVMGQTVEDTVFGVALGLLVLMRHRRNIEAFIRLQRQ